MPVTNLNDCASETLADEILTLPEGTRNTGISHGASVCLGHGAHTEVHTPISDDITGMPTIQVHRR
jgi:hypothetical protein